MKPHRYRISVAGHLGPAARQAFDGFEIICVEGRTDVVGELDQAALFGLLRRVQGLALELVEVHREAKPLTNSPIVTTGFGEWI